MRLSIEGYFSMFFEIEMQINWIQLEFIKNLYTIILQVPSKSQSIFNLQRNANK